MKQKARLEIQQNSEDGTCRLQLWQDTELVKTIDGIENVYPAMDEIMLGLRQDYIAQLRPANQPQRRLFIP